MKWTALIILLITIFLNRILWSPYLPLHKYSTLASRSFNNFTFQDKDHSFINDTLINKKTQLVLLYYVYKPNRNAPRTDIRNYDELANKYGPTYGGESNSYHRHMISVVVFFYSNTHKSMLVDYIVTDMGCFDDCSDAEPRSKIMRGNGITTLLFHVSPFITFHQKNIYSNLEIRRCCKIFNNLET